MTDHIKRAYRADTFRAQGHQLIDQLADYLEQLQVPDPHRSTIDYQEPEALLAFWRNWTSDDPIALTAAVLQQSVAVHHPRYMGHQISPSAPVAALMGLVGDLLNNGMGVYEMGMAGSVIERVVMERMATALNLGPQAGGFFTSGGTLANLTALLTARSLKVPDRVWTEGQQEPLALMVSDEAHYCVDRAARIMGWGEAGVIKVPTDANYRMQTALLPQYLERARASGRRVIALVGSACTTATGAFDNLEALADFAEANDLWLHVDGAHGAPLALAPSYRHRVAGMERADSVAMDFHKMLLTPSVTTGLFYQRHRDTYATFQQRATYLLEWEQADNWSNLARRTFECTKLMIGLKAFSILSTHGLELWQDYVERACRLTEHFAERLTTYPYLELATQPQANIICFRYRPTEEYSPEQLDQLNRRLRRELLEDGSFYIVQTQLNKGLFLRCTLTNPFTEVRHIDQLLQAVEKLGRKLSAEPFLSSAT